MYPRSKTYTQALAFYINISTRTVTHWRCWHWTSREAHGPLFLWWRLPVIDEWNEFSEAALTMSMILHPRRLLIPAVYVSGIGVAWCRSKWAGRGHMLRHKWGTGPWSSQGGAGSSPQTQCCQLSNRLSWATCHGSAAVPHSPTVLGLRWTCLLAEGNPLEIPDRVSSIRAMFELMKRSCYTLDIRPLLQISARKAP